MFISPYFPFSFVFVVMCLQAVALVLSCSVKIMFQAAVKGLWLYVHFTELLLWQCFPDMKLTRFRKRGMETQAKIKDSRIIGQFLIGT
jgi:hypothetical protein